jgi:tetratricopeptide (TPR) repeat protein
MLTDLSTTPIAERLLRHAREYSTGDLQVRSGKIVKTAFFDHGRVVFAASNMKKDRLGEALVAVGRITQDEYDRASAFMREGELRRRFGEALVRSGVMDKGEVGRSVARQVKRVVLSLFDFTDGIAVFEDRACPIPLEYMVSLSVHRLVYIGIKSMKSRELILAGLGDLDRWVALAEVPPFRFGVKKCSAEEMEILEAAKKRVTLRRLAWAPGGLSLSRLRTTYALLASGLLQEVGVKDKGPTVQMETSTFLLSALRSRPDPTAREAIRQEVARELESSARLDREKWLKVSRSAPREDLGKALEEKMEHYHSLLEAAGDDADLKTDIEVILGRASSMLRLARHAPEATPAQSAAPPAPPPPSAPRAQPPETKPMAPVQTSEPATAAAAPPQIMGEMAIDHLLMEGEIRMTVSDYANAVKVYSKLVDLAPYMAVYHVKLAIAMAFYPPMAKQAEREFIEAVRLDPENPDIHYQFGLYYKAMRVKTRAITEMQTAVRLNPNHKMAREELQALSPKDSALTTLKKLFK